MLSAPELGRRAMPRLDVGAEYSSRDLLTVLGLPDEAGGGGWFQGYHRYGAEFYVFATLRKPGRGANNRRDHWEGEQLRWSAKRGSTLEQRPIQQLLSGRFKVHVFWRPVDYPRFIYRGEAVPTEASSTSPVTVLWDFPSKKE
jgi:hypothetical protein